MSFRYRVYATPRVSDTAYGAEVDISDYVQNVGIKNIIRGFDSGDYDVGIYVFGDIDLVCYDRDGKLSDEFDSRTIFRSGRDLAKIRVVFSAADGDTTTFNGLITESATRDDFLSGLRTFRVLSQDSVIRTAYVTGGQVTAGDTCTAAIKKILNVPMITKVLTFDLAQISVGLDFTIDDPTAFENRSVKDVMTEILTATSSVMIIDSTGTIVVRSRTEDQSRPTLNLYGKSDIFARENIVAIQNYNTGWNRIFTSFSVNGQVATSSAFATGYGFRQKTLTFKWITSNATALLVATKLLNQFSVPKIELQVQIATQIAKGVKLLDRVSINYPLRIKPAAGSFLPVVGISKIGGSDLLPSTVGQISISPAIAFKVTEIQDDPSQFLTTLKLRQVGSTTSDGFFNVAGNAIVGFAIVGQAVISGVGTGPEYNPAYVGGAKVGFTKVA